MRKLTFLILLLVIVTGAIWIGSQNRRARTNESVNPFGAMKDFSLVNQNGEKFTLKNTTGKIWVASFIFTRCMGPCPILSSRVKELQNRFKEKPTVSLISFSVDPDYDTPEVLTQYGKKWNADFSRWNFLTGPRNEIAKTIQENFMVGVGETGKDKNGFMDIAHSTRLFVIDGTGQIQGSVNGLDADSISQVETKVNTLLAASR